MEKIKRSFRRLNYDVLKTSKEKNNAKKVLNALAEGVDYVIYNTRSDIAYIVDNYKVIGKMSKSDLYRITKSSFKSTLRNRLTFVDLDDKEIKDYVSDLKEMAAVEDTEEKCTCNCCSCEDFSCVTDDDCLEELYVSDASNILARVSESVIKQIKEGKAEISELGSGNINVEIPITVLFTKVKDKCICIIK
jgi:hypothetical protein